MSRTEQSRTPPPGTGSGEREGDRLVGRLLYYVRLQQRHPDREDRPQVHSALHMLDTPATHSEQYSLINGLSELIQFTHILNLL